MLSGILIEMVKVFQKCFMNNSLLTEPLKKVAMFASFSTFKGSSTLLISNWYRFDSEPIMTSIKIRCNYKNYLIIKKRLLSALNR